jgi:sulfur-carrier protein
MNITVRYFASLREALGSSETVALDVGVTVAALRDSLIARGGKHAQALQRGKAVRCAVNQNMVDETAALNEGAEVAFFPPVTGG